MDRRMNHPPKIFFFDIFLIDRKKKVTDILSVCYPKDLTEQNFKKKNSIVIVLTKKKNNPLYQFAFSTRKIKKNFFAGTFDYRYFFFIFLLRLKIIKDLMIIIIMKEKKMCFMLLNSKVVIIRFEKTLN